MPSARTIGVTPLLIAIPPESTRQGPDGVHSGNPHVRARKGLAEHVAWVRQRPDGGRGFGFTGGDLHWNWANDDYRKFVLNGIIWSAGREVPHEGVPSRTPTFEELDASGKRDALMGQCSVLEVKLSPSSLRPTMVPVPAPPPSRMSQPRPPAAASGNAKTASAT